MSETITLPRSGLVLTRLSPTARGLSAGICDVGGDEHGTAYALKVFLWDPPRLCADFGSASYGGSTTRDALIAWLDDCACKTRAALLPADARERVARALTKILSERFPDKLIYEYADAVLQALGVPAREEEKKP